MKVIATCSGKGGVGKTAVSQGLALALAARGYQVGLLDLDLCSSSQGDATGLTHDKLKLGLLIEPVDFHGVKTVSLYMFPGAGWEDVPTLLTEERTRELIDQLFHSVNWGDLDFMIVDLPPGTGAEIRALAVKRRIDALVLVVVPQRIAEMPVRRLIRMAREEYHIRIVGIVENNAYNSEGSAGDNLSKSYGLPLLTSIPWDHAIVEAMDSRQPLDHGHFVPIAAAVEEVLDSDLARIRQMRAEGKSYETIAKEMGLPKSQVFRKLNPDRKKKVRE